MIKHRAQHADDRTHADAPREQIVETDPTTAAVFRNHLYWEKLFRESEDGRDDIEFAALTGPDTGPVAPGYEKGTGSNREILAGRPHQPRLTGIS